MKTLDLSTSYGVEAADSPREESPVAEMWAVEREAAGEWR